jgi:hypothetical protein
MSDVYTTGTWEVSAGNDDAFVEAWMEFAAWASGMPGAGVLSLARRPRRPHRFVSCHRLSLLSGGQPTGRASASASSRRELTPSLA